MTSMTRASMNSSSINDAPSNLEKEGYLVRKRPRWCSGLSCSPVEAATGMVGAPMNVTKMVSVQSMRPMLNFSFYFALT